MTEKAEMTDAEVVARANALARRFYQVQGYAVPEGYRFDRATHPHEVAAWAMACIAFEEMRDTDVEDALANLDEEEAEMVPGPDRVPITDPAELETLDQAEVIEGYFDGRANEPEPGHNRSRAYWHGWRNGMADGMHRPIDEAQRTLARAFLATQKGKTDG